MTALVSLPAVGKNVFDLPPAVYTGEFRFYNHVSPRSMKLYLVCNGTVLVSKQHDCKLWTHARVSLWDTHFPVKPSKATPLRLHIEITPPDPLRAVQAVIVVDAGERVQMAVDKVLMWTSDNILTTVESDSPREESQAVRINYTNYRGETASRQIVPLSISFKASEYHKEPQWLMSVYDLDKEARRDMAIKDMTDWTPVSHT